MASLSSICRAGGGTTTDRSAARVLTRHAFLYELFSTARSVCVINIEEQIEQRDGATQHQPRKGWLGPEELSILRTPSSMSA